MLLLMLVILLLVAMAVFLLSAARVPGIMGFPYVKQAGLLSPAERSFLGVLEQAVGTNFRILMKVRVADVLGVAPGLRSGQRLTAFNKISAKHFDFVLVDSKTFVAVAAIELDDKSHEKPGRRRRDEFLGAACAAAHLPLIRIPERRAYEVPVLRREILHTLFPPVIASDVVEAVVAMVAAK